MKLLDITELHCVYQKFLVFAGVFLLAACSISSQIGDLSTPSQTLPIVVHPSQTTSIFTITPTSTTSISDTPDTGTPKPEPSVTSTIMPSQFTDFRPGQYILYGSQSLSALSNLTAELKFVSVDGDVVGTTAILENIGFPFAKLSPDGNYLAYGRDSSPSFSILNLESSEITSGPQTDDYCLDLNWSPDSTKLVVSCSNLFTYSLLDKAFTKITTYFPFETPYHAPAWSPDGKWIVYHQLYDNMWDRDKGGGVFLIDTSCLSNSATCQEKARFLCKFKDFYSPSWSPDSQHFAAFIAPGNIVVWDIEADTFREITVSGWVQSSTLANWGYLAWSPDGEWLAYSRASANDNPDAPTYFDVFVIPAEGGEPQMVVVSPQIKLVMGWQIIPWPFSLGDLYTITDARADLNLRAEPSIDGETLRKLQPGDTVTILDGPVEADGYTWWQMRVEDGTTGWAVNIPEWYAPGG